MTQRLFILASLVAIAMAGHPVFASRTESTAPRPRESNARNSEFNSLIFDELQAEIGREWPTVFIVSHLGKGERLARLHLRRLHNARKRWFHGETNWQNRVMLVAGERASGAGTVEFYINGVRRWIVTFDKGDDFYVDCCGPMPGYYPWFRGASSVAL